MVEAKLTIFYCHCTRSNCILYIFTLRCVLCLCNSQEVDLNQSSVIDVVASDSKSHLPHVKTRVLRIAVTFREHSFCNEYLESDKSGREAAAL